MSDSDSDERKRDEVGKKPYALHEGEVEAQRRFGVAGL